MDTAFLRDTAAGEVVLDSLGRPMKLYNDEPDSEKMESRESAPSRETARSVSDSDDDGSDDDRPRKKKSKGKKKGKGKH